MTDTYFMQPLEISYDALCEMDEVAATEFGLSIPEELRTEPWKFFLVADAVVAELPTTGPREPALVWDGEQWICSEDDLTPEQEDLMDDVASRCPGGLAGWS